jgi:hypothetical protein
VLGECGGYVVLPLGEGVDGLLLFMYGADAGTLAAVLASGDLQEPLCVGGNASFAIPVSCFSDFGDDLPNAFTGPGGEPACAVYDAGSLTDAGGPD